MILFFDHEDSFSGNLVHALRARSCSVDVKTMLRNEPISIEKCDEWAASATGVVLSPGPGNPREYDTFQWVESLMIRKKKGTLCPSLHGLPLLGVCLGHQILLMAGGASIRPCRKSQVHGRTSYWSLSTSPFLPPHFRGLKASSQVVYYNSLEIPYASTTSITGWEDWYLLPEDTHQQFNGKSDGQSARARERGKDGAIVFAAHRDEPWFGVQFHPESYASPCGGALLDLFASLCTSRERSAATLSGGRVMMPDWRAIDQ